MVINAVKNSKLYNLVGYDELRYHRHHYLIDGGLA
jgi:hypothetical protein